MIVYSPAAAREFAWSWLTMDGTRAPRLSHRAAWHIRSAVSAQTAILGSLDGDRPTARAAARATRRALVGMLLYAEIVSGSDGL